MPGKYHTTGKPLDLSTKPTVPKSIGLVEMAGGHHLTLQDRRLFDTLLAIAYEHIEHDEEHSVRLIDLRRLCARSSDESPHKGNERIKESIKRLKSLVLEFNSLGNGEANWAYITNLLGDVRYSEGKDILYYEFPKPLRSLLVDPAIHARIRLAVIYKFNSKYSLILYEILQRHADRRLSGWEWPVNINELKLLLSVEDKFPNYKDLKRRVLDPAITEINEHAPYTVNFKEVRAKGPGTTRGRGAKVLKVIFKVARKERNEIENTTKLKNKPLSERTAAEGASSDQADEAMISKAYSFLDGADIAKRQDWAKRAEALGVKMPKAATSRENLRLWVRYVAPLIVKEEFLKF